jgi:hypothetical protein
MRTLIIEECTNSVRSTSQYITKQKTIPRQLDTYHRHKHQRSKSGYRTIVKALTNENPITRYASSEMEIDHLRTQHGTIHHQTVIIGERYITITCRCRFELLCSNHQTRTKGASLCCAIQRMLGEDRSHLTVS